VQVERPSGHEATLACLWNAARSKRLPHALLFEGRPGIGKFMAAKWFALGCLCARGPGEPCRTCGPCKRVLSGGERGNHADLFVIDPLLEGEERIRIGRIALRDRQEGETSEQSLEAFLSLRPLEGALRLALVRESQRMNEHAQNALLKTLEEPRPGTVLVLETSSSSALLPTIRSRCIRLRFEPLTLAQCEDVLRGAGLEPAAAHELARLAGGSPGRALTMAQNGTREICARLAAAACGEREPLDVAAELWELEGEFSGKTPAASERERARVVLELAQALLADAWRARAGVPVERLAHDEIAPRLAARASERQLFARGEALLAARADVERNLAPAAVLQRALLVLGEGVAPLRG
jgi:DNA polymerase-3 subunit delta'